MDESDDDSALEEANCQFGYISLSSPQDERVTNLNPEIEDRSDFKNVKPLTRDVSSIPNWLLTHIESGTQIEGTKTEERQPSDHLNHPVKSLQRSDTVPRWMLPHIRRDDTDTETPVQPAQPPSRIKRKSVSWATDARKDHPHRPAPATPRFTLQKLNPDTPYHHRSNNSLLLPSSPVPDQEEADLIERLGQAAENRDRNYTGVEGRRIEWESARRMSAEAEGWEAEVKQALEARERRGGPVAQWVKKEMREKARDLWRKVKGTR